MLFITGWNYYNRLCCSQSLCYLCCWCIFPYGWWQRYSNYRIFAFWLCLSDVTEPFFARIKILIFPIHDVSSSSYFLNCIMPQPPHKEKPTEHSFCSGRQLTEQKKRAAQCGRADEGNRTPVCSLEGCRSTIELHLQNTPNPERFFIISREPSDFNS